ncbi:MAG: hypothetical protein DRG55_01805 [Deltaproteobacteria bacterium]|nr:MAG: hypothetical protein DRG69_07835 [Deltaproteobacteria bacterium]RLB02875.1 MAG: hypothetical protein DRG55_01805 [Deltaproteobacteria bacterium]
MKAVKALPLLLLILMGVVYGAEKAQEVKREPLFVYDPTGKRDPFRPFIKAEEPVQPKGVVLSPLQRYDLSQLKLVAIIVGAGEERAMVEDAEGKGYIIRRGTYIGNRFGRVKEILPDRVIVVEKYRDYLGRVRTREVVLKLHPVEEERP